MVFTEYEQIPNKKPNGTFSTATLPENAERSRIREVVPYEENRVELIPTKENNTGYINASHIKVRGLSGAYGKMPAWAELVTAENLSDVLALSQGEWDCPLVLCLTGGGLWNSPSLSCYCLFTLFHSSTNYCFFFMISQPIHFRAKI